MQPPGDVHVDPAQVVSLLVLPELLVVLAALLVAQVLTGAARRKVGRVLAAERPGTRARRVGMSVVTVLVLALIAARGEVWLPLPLLCGVAALLLVWTTPGFHDAVLGEGGVQRGWHARRFEALEEWRLTGAHLRFRLFGEWTSVPCPPERHADLRARLLALAPERESPFQD